MFTREEILGGLQAKRARTLLFLIESRVAHLVAKSRQAMDPFLTEEVERERDLAYIDAFSAGREPPLRPTIQDLERHAPQWAHLVPENISLRAAVAHFVGEKYRFTKQSIPEIRKSLGLDTADVQDSYRRLYGKPLESIYQPEISLLDRLRWAQSAASSWLESLPPFWAVFSLTLTETVGAGIMALPIAVAMVGPIPGIVLLVTLGLINILTIAAIAETVARTGSVRYGNSFFGRIVGEYLGGIGSSIVTVALALICLVAMLAYYLGFSSVLADATGLRAEVWAALLFLVALYFLSRGSLNSTIASALAIGAINIVLVLALAFLGFMHFKPENLAYVNVPFIDGRPFDPGILELIFGVVLAAYFGHTSVGNCGKLVLQRDPSSRSLVLGVAAAQVAAIAIFSLWVLAVNCAVPPLELANEQRTSLTPLVAVAGPVVHPLGSLFVLLAMGMASVHFSFALFNLVRERLPSAKSPVLLLQRQRGRITLKPKGDSNRDLRLSIAYVGNDGGQTRFRVDALNGGIAVGGEAVISASWDESDLFDRFPKLRDPRITLTVDLLEANAELVRLGLSTPMEVEYEETPDAIGTSLLDILADWGSDGQLLTWMVRQGEVSLTDVMAHLGLQEGDARAKLEMLASKGRVQLVSSGEATRYRAAFGRKRGRKLPSKVWDSLDGLYDDRTPVASPRSNAIEKLVQMAREFAAGPRGRFIISLSPVLAVLILAEVMIITGSGSFSEMLSFLGVLTITTFSGIFPVLMLISSRRKGDIVPPVVYRFMGHPWLMGFTYLIFVLSIFIHGIIIWQGAIERAAAILCGVGVLIATYVILRRGAFQPRVVVELRQDTQEDKATFGIVTTGEMVPADVSLELLDDRKQLHTATGTISNLGRLRRAIFKVPSGFAGEFKVWVHRVTPDGQSESIPARLEMKCGCEQREFDLKLTGGQVVHPLPESECSLEITLNNTQ
ncbi:MAG: aromatic amino acid transport family protein [Chloroflexota bacterium]